jgi:hypothetical protein
MIVAGISLIFDYYLVTGLAVGFLSGMWLVVGQIHTKFYSERHMTDDEYDQVMARLFGRWW